MIEKQTTTVFATKRRCTNTKVDMIKWIVVLGLVEMAAIFGLYLKA